MKIRMIGILLLLFLAASPFWAHAWNIGVGSDTFAPTPELVSPTGEVCDLTGKTEAVFRWRPFVGELSRRRAFEFHLYRGYQTYAKNLIYKKRLSPTAYSVILPTDLFENGQIYTWTLRQIYYGQAYKSDAAYNSFVVRK